MHVVDGQDVQFPRTLNVRPEKKPVRGVIWRTALLIDLNDCLKIARDPTLGLAGVIANEEFSS